MIKEIYLAGGCFWGTEMYLKNIKGVLNTEVGYANGDTENPSYEQVCYDKTGHAETVKVEYNDEEISLSFLLSLYYDIINPTNVNRQGGDVGLQYRTGIYYTDENDEEEINKSIQKLQRKYKKKIAIEVKPLLNYYKAEQYHQKYLDKNPNGYCHINAEKFENARNAVDKEKRYIKLPKVQLQKKLNRLQYEVTQNNATEPPFNNEYFNHFEEGIYVDVTTGEPLFTSKDKYEFGCGWPSFSKPINSDVIINLKDKSHGMSRTEIRSKIGDAHLGHVFEDGPKNKGGIRYCINSAALKFIKKENMKSEGYGWYLKFL